MWAEKWGSLWPCIITSWSRMTLKAVFVFWILSAWLGCSTVEEIATFCCVWGVLMLDKDPLSLAVTPLFWKKKKNWRGLNALQKGREDLRYSRNTCSGVLLWATWNLQALLFSWPATYSGQWNQIICMQGEIHSLEYRNTFRRVKLWVEFMKQRGGCGVS